MGSELGQGRKLREEGPWGMELTPRGTVRSSLLTGRLTRASWICSLEMQNGSANPSAVSVHKLMSTVQRSGWVRRPVRCGAVISGVQLCLAWAGDLLLETWKFLASEHPEWGFLNIKL